MGQETVRIDSAQFGEDDAPTKVISGELTPEVTPQFDPFKTVLAQPERTVTEGPRDTREISSPSTTLPPTAPPPPAPPAAPGQVSQSPPPPSSVPLPPPQSSQVAPTMALTGSGSIAPAAPPLPPQLASTPQSPAATPPGKKSKLPLVLGILAVLLLLGGGVLGVAYWFVVRPMLARRVVVVDTPRKLNPRPPRSPRRIKLRRPNRRPIPRPPTRSSL